MTQKDTTSPKLAIEKIMTVTEKPDKVFQFFSNVKNMEIGGAIKSVTKSNDSDWWEFDHIVAGRGRIKLDLVPEHGIIDHIFVAGGIEWRVYVRIIPNQNGSTTTWTFLRPDAYTDEEFRTQLEGFEMEIRNWKNFLEGRKE
jgi:hypothetical protein